VSGRALEKHLAKIPEHEKKHYREVGNKKFTLEDSLSKIQKHGKTHREQSLILSQSESVSSFLRVLDRFMAGISIACQANPEISCIVVGFVRVVIDMAMGFLALSVCSICVHNSRII
jgi:hypothetical protein